MTDMISEDNFRKNLDALKGLIENSCSEAGRNTKDVSILPVTKNWPFAAIGYASSAGFTRVGENRVQEALAKQSDISGRAFTSGKIISSTLLRSFFLAHPGNEAPFRFLAKRIRLVITTELSLPFPVIQFAGCFTSVEKRIILQPLPSL